MDRFLQLQVFVAVAEEQGFAAAARRLNSSPPAVTRAIASLEKTLGVQLLNRTTRAVRVTEPGQRYLEDARQILSAIAAADDSATGINSEPRGHLAVTAPVLFGQKFVIAGVVDYLNRYPETRVETLFVDRVVNLVEEGLDVGVRIGHLPDSSLKAIRVGEVSRVTVASKEYLEAFGVPNQPRDLQSHRLISVSAFDTTTTWRFGKEHNESVRVQPRLATTTNDAAIEATIQSFGIARLLSYQVIEHLEQGQLVRVLRDFEGDPLPIHIVHREGRYAAARIRAFIDLLVERLRQVLEQEK